MKEWDRKVRVCMGRDHEPSFASHFLLCEFPMPQIHSDPGKQALTGTITFSPIPSEGKRFNTSWVPLIGLFFFKRAQNSRNDITC
jgi:hypothetical protein